MKQTENDEVRHGNDAPANGPGDNQGTVTITIDNKPIEVRRGQHKVAELKGKGSVNADYALSQVIDGVLTELADDQKVHIRGGEVFHSNPKSGGTS
jgi:hypothetical protein